MIRTVTYTNKTVTLLTITRSCFWFALNLRFHKNSSGCFSSSCMCIQIIIHWLQRTESWGGQSTFVVTLLVICFQLFKICIFYLGAIQRKHDSVLLFSLRTKSRAIKPFTFSELCTQHILCACLAWFRGGARTKPHSRSTVVWTWWKWAPSALPSGCGTFQLSLLSVKSLVLWLSFCSTETASRSWGEFLTGSRGGQLKDKALLQESLRGEERHKEIILTLLSSETER